MKKIIEMKNITKVFPGVIANDKVSLTVNEGEVHALIGENGAGKSTLMAMLFGMSQPTSGDIFINNKKTIIKNPNVATDLGIGMVHQHFKLIDIYSVLENIILGSEPTSSFGVLNKSEARKKLQNIADTYNLKIDMDMLIENATVGEQQRTEILKVLYRDAEIIVFDEPTAVLTPQQIKGFLEVVKSLKAAGKTIIFISHKLKEIKEIADRATILRKGKAIKTIDVKKTTEEQISKLMVGKQVEEIKNVYAKGSDSVLKLEKVTVKDSSGVTKLSNFDLEVKKGEIVSVAGVEGNGQNAIVKSIIGLAKTESGKISFKGKSINDLSTNDRYNLGLSYVAGDRHKYASAVNLSVSDNINLININSKKFTENRVNLDREKMDKYTSEVVDKYDVRGVAKNSTKFASLSGGNQQKAIVGRELSRDTELVILVQPTRGLDVGAINALHSEILKAKSEGRAVLLISYELSEIMSLSDKIVAINAGKRVGMREGKNMKIEDIGLMMTGINKKGGAKMKNKINNLWIASRNQISAIVIGMVLTTILLALLGYNPFSFFGKTFELAFDSGTKSNQRTFMLFSMLTLSGISFAIASKVGLFNIGVAGQYLMSGGLGTYFALKIAPSLPPYLGAIILMIIMIIIASSYAMLAGWLKVKFNVHEVVSTILLNWVAFYLMKSIFAPDVAGLTGLSQSLTLPSWTRIFIGFNYVWPVIITILVLVGYRYLFGKTKLGFELIVTGESKTVAESSGMSANRNIIVSMALSGAVAGLLAYVSYVMNARSFPVFSSDSLPAIGFDGIAIGLVGSLSYIGIPAFALFYAILSIGSAAVQPILGVPNEIISLSLGLILFLAALRMLFDSFWVKNDKRKNDNKKTPSKKINKSVVKENK